MASRGAASSAARAAPSSSPAATPKSTTTTTSDPIILRNALRYTISAREYALLHKYVISRSRVLRRRAPTVDSVTRMMEGDGSGVRQDGKGKTKGKATEKGKGKAGDKPKEVAPAVVVDDYNARAIRHALRVFVATGAGMKAWEAVSARFMGGNKKEQPGGAKEQKPSALRLSLSLSSILLLYRLLFRFLTRLRVHLLDPLATPFRVRNPRTAATLTSPYAPAVGASLAGLALGVYPSQQLRVSVAIYTMFRALEFGWNCAEENGMVWGWEKGVGGRPDKMRARPAWWGSWMLQPFAFGQLLHAVVFDRDCFPASYGDLIFKNSSAYLQTKPADYPLSIKWPKTYEIVDSLAEMARLNWPSFISPTLFPGKDDVLPASLSAIAPLTSPAHPLITSLSCATLHPSDPSCSRTFLTFWLRSFPPLTRFLLLAYSAMFLPKFKALYNAPVRTLRHILARALRMSTFVTGAIATSWSSVCFFQAWLPRAWVPTQRFFLGGFVAGFWALVEGRAGRPLFLYSARVSVDSLWKVGVKRRWWRAMRGGDVWVFVAALMLTGVVYERDAKAVKEGTWRKGISWVRGEGWRDWSAEEEEEEEEEGRED